MSAQKPIYSRPSDDNPTPAPRRKRHRKRAHRRKGLRTTDTLAAAQVKEIAEHDPLHENEGVAEHHPHHGHHHTRNQRTHRREKRRARELRAENERLHRRLAAIYDALSID